MCNSSKQIKNFKLEKNTVSLLIAIIGRKNLKAVSRYTWIFLGLLTVIIIPLIVYSWNRFHIKTIYLFDFLSNLITVLSILIGFSITSISMLSIGISENAITKLKGHPSELYPNASTYEAALYVFFEYLYSLLISLIFIMCCLFVRSYLVFFIKIKMIITWIFFYLLFYLLYWNFLSMKSLVYNLYAIITINTLANNQISSTSQDE